jgi:hypothetical protein
MYARNAGIIGSMHGARNDPNPANAATATVISDMINLVMVFFIKD